MLSGAMREVGWSKAWRYREWGCPLLIGEPCRNQNIVFDMPTVAKHENRCRIVSTDE